MSLPQSGALERYSTQVDFNPTLKHQIRQERPAMIQHSSLLQTSVDYGLKKVHNNGPRMTECHLPKWQADEMS